MGTMTTLDFASLASRHRNYVRSGATRLGKYHGDWGFRAYTNARGVLRHSARLDPSVRYPPYDRNQVLRRMVMPA